MVATPRDRTLELWTTTLDLVVLRIGGDRQWKPVGYGTAVHWTSVTRNAFEKLRRRTLVRDLPKLVLDAADVVLGVASVLESVRRCEIRHSFTKAKHRGPGHERTVEAVRFVLRTDGKVLERVRARPLEDASAWTEEALEAFRVFADAALFDFGPRPWTEIVALAELENLAELDRLGSLVVAYTVAAVDAARRAEWKEQAGLEDLLVACYKPCSERLCTFRRGDRWKK